MILLENLAALSVPAVYALAVFIGFNAGKWYKDDQ